MFKFKKCLYLLLLLLISFSTCLGQENKYRFGISTTLNKYFESYLFSANFINMYDVSLLANYNKIYVKGTYGQVNLNSNLLLFSKFTYKQKGNYFSLDASHKLIDEKYFELGFGLKTMYVEMRESITYVFKGNYFDDYNANLYDEKFNSLFIIPNFYTRFKINKHFNLKLVQGIKISTTQRKYIFHTSNILDSEVHYIAGVGCDATFPFNIFNNDKQINPIYFEVNLEYWFKY